MSEEAGFTYGEPAVINNSLLTRLAIEQGAKGTQARKLLLADGIELNEIKEIRIEFSNILKIDNLWMMSNRLMRLRLSNNIIEKIDNLDSLVNLRELDLSFNRIRVMENLESLVNLEILLLYENEISEVCGIERSTNLTILSIGGNKIENWDHVMYLRQFSNLRVLNVTGNKCTEQEGYTNYLIAFLPQLLYLNYKMIDKEERKIAFEVHSRAIATLMDKESMERAEEKEMQDRQEKLALLSLSYVEYLDGDELFEQLYEHDREGKELLAINDDTRAAFDLYRTNFINLCIQLYEIGIREHDRREQELQLFTKMADEAREVTQGEARAAMEEVIQQKVKIFEQVSKLSEMMAALKDDANLAPDVEEKQVNKARRLADEFDGILANARIRFLQKEVIFHEQMEGINERFKSNMGDMVNVFIEAARSFFSQMRYAGTEYMENLDGIVNLYINNFSESVKMPANHVAVCGDRDILKNSATASRDLHFLTVDGREDAVITRIKNWYDNYKEHIEQEEIQRNRTQILEISHFLEYQRQEFDDIQSQLLLQSGASAADVLAAMEG